MSFDENLYRAPEAPLSDRPGDTPRPVPVFFFGASCIGGSIPFLLMMVAVVVGFVRRQWMFGWAGTLATRRDFLMIGVGLVCGICAVALCLAGRSFLARQGQRGRQILLLFAAAFLGLIALFAAWG